MGDCIITTGSLIGHILREITKSQECLSKRDFSRYLIVFPGKRPAYYLKHSIARLLMSPYRPPVIMSIDEFIDYISEEIFDEKRRKITPLEAIKPLYDTVKSKGIWQVKISDFLSSGPVLFSDLEELRIEGISPEHLKSRDLILEGISQEASERLVRLSEIYDDFYKRLASLGLSTRADRYHLVASNAGKVLEALERDFDRIIFAGFFAFTRVEAYLFREFLRSPRVILYFKEGRHLREQLHRQGIPWRQDKVSQPFLAEIEPVACPDRHGQVLAFRAKAEGLRPDINIALVLPETSLLPPLLRFGIGDLQEEHYNITMGYPLYKTPLYNFFLILLHMLASRFKDRVYLKDYLRFIMHPYTKNVFLMGSMDPEPTRQMLQRLRERLLNEGVSFLELEEIERKAGQDRPHLRYLHKNLIDPFLYLESIKDFVGALKGVLLFIYKESTASYHPLFQPYAERFLEVFDELGDSVWAPVSLDDLQGYMLFFKKVIAKEACPFEGTPLRGLQVMGLLETRGLEFDSVFVFDCNEDILPGGPTDNTFIPLYSRRLLGLPTHKERSKLMEYYFDTLIRGSKRAVLFYVEDDRRRKSPFVERLIWEKEKALGRILEKEDIDTLSYRFVIKNQTPMPVEKTADLVEHLRKLTISPSALDVYLQCGLRFYYSYVLRLRDDTPETDTDRAGIGRIVHDVLAGFFRPKRGRILQKEDLIEEEIEEILSRHFPEDKLKVFGPSTLVRRQIEKRLRHHIIMHYREMIDRGSVEILGVEEELRMEVKGINLYGRVDLVQRQDGRVFIVDFKTSSQDQDYRIKWDELQGSPRQEWPSLIRSLQVPCYIYLYALTKGVPYERLSGVYHLLGKQKGDYLFNPFKDEEIGEKMALVEEIIMGLLREIFDPQKAFGPAEDLKKACPHCSYTVVCGTQWVVR